MMQLKIIASNEPYRSAVVNAATGEVVNGVTSISWSTNDHASVVTITLLGVVIESASPDKPSVDVIMKQV